MNWFFFLVRSFVCFFSCVFRIVSAPTFLIYAEGKWQQGTVSGFMRKCFDDAWFSNQLNLLLIFYFGCSFFVPRFCVCRLCCVTAILWIRGALIHCRMAFYPNPGQIRQRWTSALNVCINRFRLVNGNLLGSAWDNKNNRY